MADTALTPQLYLPAESDEPRRLQVRRHALEAILLTATLAVIWGAVQNRILCPSSC